MAMRPIDEEGGRPGAVRTGLCSVIGLSSVEVVCVSIDCDGAMTVEVSMYVGWDFLMSGFDFM